MSYAAVLIIVMHTYYGSMVATQGFRSADMCAYAAKKLYEERDRVGIKLETAFCVNQ